MKMGAIIRLVCFIKTKNHVNTVQNFTFQSANYEYNALFSFVFSKLGSYGYFPCCTSSYIKRMCLLPYIVYTPAVIQQNQQEMAVVYICYGNM
jgi:hypothetical protein